VAAEDTDDLVACFAFAKWIGTPVDLTQGPKVLDQPWAYALYSLAQFLTESAGHPEARMELTSREGKLTEISQTDASTRQAWMRVVFNADGSRTIVRGEG
jgi:hypothetical protein